MDFPALVNALGGPLALAAVVAVALWRTMVGVGKWLGCRADKALDRAHAFLDSLESIQRSQADTIGQIALTQERLAETQKHMGADLAKFRCYYATGANEAPHDL